MNEVSLVWPSGYSITPQHYSSHSAQPLVSLLHSQPHGSSVVGLGWSPPGHIQPILTTDPEGTLKWIDSGPLFSRASTSPIFHSSDSSHVNSFNFLFLLNFNRTILIYYSCINFCQNKVIFPRKGISTHRFPFSCVQSLILPVF